MVSAAKLQEQYFKEDDLVIEDTWNWWNNFRTATDTSHRTKLSLVMSEDVPEPKELLRWLGEPIDSIVLPASIFVSNAAFYPVLTKRHQELFSQFINNGANIIVQANEYDPRLNNINEYLRRLVHMRGKEELMAG